MRRSKRSHSLVAGILVLGMVGSITGLLGASGTTIRITSPAPGARVSGYVDIQASITTTADVAYVLFGIDGGRPYSTNSTPYVFELDTRTLADGRHRIFAEVYDKYGMLGASKAITIYVKNGSASAVQARKQPPATQVAKQPTKPKTESAAARVAAKQTAKERAKTVSAPAPAPRSASASPAVSGRGPRPEPVRTAAEPRVPTTRPTVPALQAAAGTPGELIAATPSLPEREVARTRGHTVVLNGRPVEFDVAPAITKGRMRVGFRAMFEAVGAVVSWAPETRTAKSVQPALEVEVPIGQRLARVNGRETDLGMRAVIRDGRTIVPVRFFAVATGSALHWDGATRVATVQTRPFAIAERPAED
jgi:hypothetical protein